MNKDVISIRLDSGVGEIIDKLCSELKINRGFFLRGLIYDSLLNDKVFKNFSSKLKNEFMNSIIENDRRKMNKRLYIIKNMFQRVIDMAMSYYFTTGRINMEVVNRIVGSFEKQFDNYPEDDKDSIRSDFRLASSNLKKEDFLMDYFDKIKLLKQNKK